MPITMIVAQRPSCALLALSGVAMAKINFYRFDCRCQQCGHASRTKQWKSRRRDAQGGALPAVPSSRLESPES
jgi:hypothetical protein